MTDELIARLEKATGPDREMDRDLALRFGPHRAPLWEPLHDKNNLLRNTENNDWVGFPAYTSSLDAALTLVPEMYEGEVSVSNPLIGRCSAYLHTIGKDNTTLATGITPAIALCIAALKARSVS